MMCSSGGARARVRHSFCGMRGAAACRFMQKEKNQAVLIAKGIAIIGVVSHHIANRRFDAPERDQIAMLGLLLDRSVTMFFCASGYLRALSHARKPDTPFFPFILSRGRRLLISFVVISFAYSVLYTLLVRAHLLTDGLGAAQPWWQKWIATLTCSPGGVGEQLYFLPMLFLVTALSAGLLMAIRHRTEYAFPIACVLILTAFWASDFLNALPGRPVTSWSRLAECVGVYLVGFALASRPQWTPWIGGAAAVLSTTSWAAGRMDAMHCIFWIALFSAVIVTKVRFQPLESIGRASATIYIYHTPFLLQPLLVIAAAMAPRAWHVPLAFSSMALVIATLVAAHYYISKTRFKWAAF